MMKPITQTRIEFLDYTRGWAILAILLVNIFGLSSSFAFKEEFQTYWHSIPLERTLLFIRSNILDNRIFPILSFLFGWGIGNQLKKYTNTRFIYRRLFVLLIIGVFHAFLIWWGDVLILYSICGFVVILLKDVSDKTILLLIATISLFPFYRYFPNLIDITLCQDYVHLNDLNRDELIAFLNNGGITTFLKVNLVEWLYNNVRSTPFFLPKQLIMAFAGLIVSRKDNLIDNIGRLSVSKWLYVLLIFALLCRIAGYTFLSYNANHYLVRYLLEVFIRIVEISTSIIYLLLIYKIYTSKIQLGIKKLVVAVGKMSLSNYLAHSFIGLILFHLFDFYGSFFPLTLLVIALSIFIFTGMASLLWLRRYSNGPIEFIWRKLAYK